VKTGLDFSIVVDGEHYVPLVDDPGTGVDHPASGSCHSGPKDRHACSTSRNDKMLFKADDLHSQAILSLGAILKARR